MRMLALLGLFMVILALLVYVVHLATPPDYRHPSETITTWDMHKELQDESDAQRNRWNHNGDPDP